ncbi:MAG TPA: hypothetical protein VM935_14105, partial [Chitinophagaceae bacterium]|nr:hypothetical protein [Chitinophagaceae bacterium]
MFVQAYLHTAIDLVEKYPGGEPFSTFSKKYFTIHKKFGSKDRKHIVHICYCYFRLGKSLPGVRTIDRLAIGLFLCNDYMHPVLSHIKPEWVGAASSALPTKVDILSKEFSFSLNEIFLREDSVSREINFEQFCASILYQPYTYLRLRPGKEKIVCQKLDEAKIMYQLQGKNSIQLAPGIKIDEVLKLNEEVVVQDRSSQQALD